jgi:hypothetical protein
LGVPEDLSVIGFDDAELRHCLVPQLTAVCQNTKALGREAVSLLSNIINRPSGVEPTTKALRCWLELHDSTAPWVLSEGQNQSEATPDTLLVEAINSTINQAGGAAAIQDVRAAVIGHRRTPRHHGNRPKHHT